jgi:uncharacterized protein (DUF608 family)
MTKPCDERKSGCGCRRRDFLKATGLAAAAAIGAPRLPAMAGPFEDANEYLAIIPEDKRLDPAWVRSLFERGRKDTYSDPDALRHVGMPVGGLFAGTLYLGGDGRLWLWDVFNRDQEGIQPRRVKFKDGDVPTRNGGNYIEPAEPIALLEQGFAVRIGDATRSLDLEGFAEVTFEGRYPIGRVTYRDPASPVEVTLEAFSPFIPLSADDSSLPATVMSYRVKNTGDRAVSGELVAHLENAICLDTADAVFGRRRNRVVRGSGLTAIECSAEPIDEPPDNPRPDVLFEDFEKPRYEGWTAEGEAFGEGPVEIKNIPGYQGDVGGRGSRVVNSHASAPGGDVREKDSRLGTLTSEPFAIERRFIRLLVGGGGHAGKTCVNVLVDGDVVASVTGRNDNRMQPATLNVGRYEGRQARLQIVDQFDGGWGNIGVDQIVFTDQAAENRPIHEQRDFGTMTLAVLGQDAADRALADRDAAGPSDEATAGLDSPLIGSVNRSFRLEPGEETTVDFVIAWHFPNFYARGLGSRGGAPPRVGHHYASRFDSALAVARHLAENFDRLAGATRRWVETWYDSTLPYWLLDRTMANTSTLATTTCYRFEDGRFWAWEGIGCCPGTCTHVWHYAQAPGRLFPEIERLERRRVNFGVGLHPDGGIGMRTGLDQSNQPADDGQCGRILGVLREHQMSTDDAFLKELWPKVREALEFMIRHDGNDDGILEGAQPNTLDAAWYGKISFISSLYLAALRAGEAMARDAGDDAFADQCRAIADRGGQSILDLFNGEYFIQIEDPAHQNEIGVGGGCYIDQVFGQTWAHWVGLGRLFDRQKQLSALRALWKYNFVPDVGPFREHFVQGRWYALAGDAGLLMCTWPKGGKRDDWQKHWQYMYFNECMSGFEWQAAANMIWEGDDQPDLLQAGLAVGRAIHDRYNAALRNPYNEIECSDHYSRAMASYGVFQAVSGFNCHGPKGHVEFSPRLSPEDFRAAFTAAGGWGTIAQRRSRDVQQNTVTVRWGRLRLRTLGVDVPEGRTVAAAAVTAAGQPVAAAHSIDGRRVTVALDSEAVLDVDQPLEVELKLA